LIRGPRRAGASKDSTAGPATDDQQLSVIVNLPLTFVNEN
jgi:hypothetical protein